MKPPLRHSFTTMGTVVTVIAPGKTGGRTFRSAVATVEHVFHREDRRFSRFRPDSELSRVNAAAGQWVEVSRPFAVLTERSLRAAAETDGLFDPTVLPALAAAGYDRDWADVEARGDEEDEELAAIRREFAALMIKHSTACGAWREIELDGTNLRIPEGAALDFGGIAKGWTVDRAADKLPDLRWAIVNAGGDLRVVGTPPRGGLDVGVEDPHDATLEALRLGLSSGALATTSVTVRAWGDGNHHVIDPRTSLPAMTEVVQATVWGETCADAEVWSKAALLRGQDILERISASLVLASGQVVTNMADADDAQVPA
ncbi:MAG TPA: FAD:protein FMN transferase [Actinomycetota bacterium]|jgi:thiamine biosynthesis lipoprotein|nr:FAD:protein FMN transferase [Actinomycetota bacterium]